MPVYKDKKTNKWYYEFNYKTTTGATKRRKKRGFELKSEAKEAEALEKIRLNEDSPSFLTMEQLSKLYIEAKHQEWLPGSEREFMIKLNSHILPTFKNLHIDKITAKDIENWKNEMYNKTMPSGKKYSISTLNGTRGHLSALFNYAIKHQYISYNPVHSVPAFKDPNQIDEVREKSVWSPDEFKTFISVIDNEKWKVFFTFLWSTGVRIGEAQGVMFKDVDFDNGRVKIYKSIDTKQKGKPYVINPTKTKRSREIELPQKLTEMLRSYCDKYRKKSDYDEEKFLFGYNKPLPNTTINKARTKYIDLSGVKNISLHCFRHSHATLLLSYGIDIKSVADRLGHKDVKETLNTYAHVLKSNKDKILNIISSTLKAVE